MAILLGDKHTFAAEVGDWAGGLCRVDLWAADHWLTCDDNMVYVLQFRRAVTNTARRVRAGHGSLHPSPTCNQQQPIDGSTTSSRPSTRTMRSLFPSRVGPTTDNLETQLFRDGDHLTITFRFWREAHLRKHPEHRNIVLVAEPRPTSSP
jgi:hypothetical protein